MHTEWQIQFRLAAEERKQLEAKQVARLAKRFNKLTVERKGSELVKNKKRSYVFMT